MGMTSKTRTLFTGQIQQSQVPSQPEHPLLASGVHIPNFPHLLPSHRADSGTPLPFRGAPAIWLQGDARLSMPHGEPAQHPMSLPSLALHPPARAFPTHTAFCAGHTSLWALPSLGKVLTWSVTADRLLALLTQEHSLSRPPGSGRTLGCIGGLHSRTLPPSAFLMIT